MYLHLEHNVLIPKGKILGIFHMDNCSWEKITRQYLALSEKDGRLVACQQDLPVSFVVVQEDFGDVTIYLSSRSSETLRKRMGMKSYLQEDLSSTGE